MGLGIGSDVVPQKVNQLSATFGLTPITQHVTARNKQEIWAAMSTQAVSISYSTNEGNSHIHLPPPPVRLIPGQTGQHQIK